MSESFSFTEYAHHVRHLAGALLRSADGVAATAGAMALLTTALERDLLRFGHDPGASSRVACGAGCDSCCVLRVSVLMPEAVAISSLLRQRLTAEALQRLRSALDEHARATRWLDDEECLHLRRPCVFVDAAGCCSIHSVRPLLCRAVTSTDASVCAEALALAPLRGQPQVEMDLFHKRLIETAYAELGWVLEMLGLEHRSLPLCATVRDLLAGGEATPVSGWS
jgi:Fe-S-cluster containining protein